MQQNYCGWAEHRVALRLCVLFMFYLLTFVSMLCLCDRVLSQRSEKLHSFESQRSFSKATTRLSSAAVTHFNMFSGSRTQLGDLNCFGRLQQRPAVCKPSGEVLEQTPIDEVTHVELCKIRQTCIDPQSVSLYSNSVNDKVQFYFLIHSHFQLNFFLKSTLKKKDMQLWKSAECHV